MQKKETVADFYQRVPSANPSHFGADNSGSGHFNVFLRDNCPVVTPYIRRDFFKISLIIGTGKLHYASKWITIDRPTLLFSNPVVPYAWEAESGLQHGWYCIFTRTFVEGERFSSLQDSPLFRIGCDPVFFPDEVQLAELSGIFSRMMREINSGYVHKYTVLRSYLHLLIHEGMKMEPTVHFQKHGNASARIAALFTELLERQFPIDSPATSLRLKTAQNYAASLSVHVNHLNRAAKEVLGKTTSELIAARVMKEARALLQHSDWNVAEIAYGLGFENPAYFSNFFRKNAGVSPNEMRSRFA
ncbi:MAG: AraC family transcriptional regulator [Chitinophagaceae bacterium]|nr:AraC family transcriptional regulator [Chitinophagaceae bacterium]